MISKNLNITLKETDFVICHEGLFCDEFTLQSIEDLEKNLPNALKKSINLTKKVIYLFVEQFQNVIRHGVKEQGQIFPEGLITVQIVEGHCVIASHNYLDKKNVKSLSHYINFLNSLSENEIKVQYKNSLGQNTFSDKGGAGLGLLDMRRRTKNKLSYKMTTAESGMIIFSLTSVSYTHLTLPTILLV